MGPEGGEEGGQLMAAGTPEQVAAVEDSYTGRFLIGAGIEPASRPARAGRGRARRAPAASGSPKVKAAA
jgi:excinuclease ABC subunit A